MKVATPLQIVISSYDDLQNPYFAGGGARAVYEVAKRLANQHYAVTVLTGKYPGSKNETIDGIHYQRIGTSWLGSKIDQLTFQLCLPFFVLTKQFDIWLESFTPPFSTNCLQIFTKKPVIGVVHMLSGEDMKRKYKLPFDVIEHIGLRTYQYIIATSSCIHDKVQKNNPKAKIVIIPNGIEKIYPTSAPAGKKYILFLGRIEINQKGIDLLLQAYGKIADKIGYPLYIAGSGTIQEEMKLKELITSLSLSKYVHMLGKVTSMDKEHAYKDAFFVVIPSRFDTFSVVALEAMAYAKALIYFHIDGLTWVPKNAGIAIQPYDVDLLAQTMLDLTRQPDKADNMGIQGQAYAKMNSFSWEHIAKSYESFINKVINKTYA